MINTNIICTIGPVSNSYEMLEKMYHCGMNVARFNMSHGSHESHGEVMERIHQLNKTIDYPVAILLDTKGPEIRTGDSEFDLTEGDTIEISVAGKEDPNRDSLYIGYPGLINAVQIGDKVTIDNGIINLEVLEKRGDSLNCKVLDGGFIKGRRHVNLPGVAVDLPAITEKDRDDILFGLQKGINYIALSFVRHGDNIRELKELMGAYVGKVKIIAKIESQEGVDNLENIMEEADGIMVARGDLGVEIDIVEVPHVQRRIARLCAQKGKRLIVATHLLESMIENPIPTRAEITDVTNAIFEEADAVMLSGETTVGKYPLKCIEYLVKLAKKTESHETVGFALRELETSDKKQSLAYSAVQLATHLNCNRLVVLTKTGRTADCVANCRATALKTYGFTDNEQTYRNMALNRGVEPYLIQFAGIPDKTIGTALEALKSRGAVESGDEVVIISDMFVTSGLIDTIQVRKVP